MLSTFSFSVQKSHGMRESFHTLVYRNLIGWGNPSTLFFFHPKLLPVNTNSSLAAVMSFSFLFLCSYLIQKRTWTPLTPLEVMQNRLVFYGHTQMLWAYHNIIHFRMNNWVIVIYTAKWQQLHIILEGLHCCLILMDEPRSVLSYVTFALFVPAV